MVRDPEKLRAWEDQRMREEPVDYAANLRFANEAIAYARRLGVFPPADPWEGIEHKIRLARILNCSKNSFKEFPGR